MVETIKIPSRPWEIFPERVDKKGNPYLITEREAIENSPNSIKWDLIQDIIGYNFKDLSLLIRAFTPAKNQQLELLGDGMIYAYAVEYFLFRFPTKGISEISDQRFKLTKNETMTQAIKNSGLHKFYNARGAKAPADLFEALLGAISLDGDKSDIRTFIANFYLKHIDFKMMMSKKAAKKEKFQNKAARGLMELHLMTFPLLLTTTYVPYTAPQDRSDKGWRHLKYASKDFFCDEYARGALTIPKKFIKYYKKSYEDFHATLTRSGICADMATKRFIQYRYGLARCEIHLDGIVIGIGEDKLLSRARCKAYVHVSSTFDADKFKAFVANPFLRQLKSLINRDKHPKQLLLSTEVSNE
jgi:hypothetical protein